MPRATSCPFCNAIDTQAASADNAGRMRCSRCGESIVAKGNDATDAGAMLSADVSGHRSAWTSWHGWLVVVLILTASGVAFGAWKTHARKKTVPPPVGVTALAPVVRPTELPGLCYLPPSTEAILAVQLPQLLNRMGPKAVDDPARALIDLGLPDQVVRTIESASGVGLKSVDQLVVGLSFEKGSFPPQMVVVVTTRGPYDLGSLVKQTKARALKKEGRTLYAVKAANAPEVYWWSPNNRVLIATILPKDFDGVPLVPRAGVEHLLPELVKLMRERVSDDGIAWLVATSDRWATYLRPYTMLPLTPLQGRTDLLGPAEQLRTLTVSIPNDPDLAVELQIERKSSIMAQELRNLLSERFRDDGVEIGGEGDICRVRMLFDASRVSSVLSRLLQESR
jgi:hypothetical protein